MVPNPQQTRSRVADLGRKGLAPGDLGEAALLLASLDRPGIPLQRYLAHFDALAGAAALASGSPSAALRAALVTEFGYAGDQKTYDDPQNANLIRVIDRRKGLPVALGILFIETARRLGCRASGLSFPNHFLIRVADGDRRVILDPFDGGAERDARDLRSLLATFHGVDATLSQEHYAEVEDLDILLRLQNNIKVRRLRNGDLDGALTVIRDMQLIAPSLSGLVREEGLLLARKGERRGAIKCLHGFLDLDGIREPERQEVARVLQVLENQLN